MLFQIIAADGEKMAARSLKEAAEIMMENKSSLQLRYLQTLGSIATEGHSQIYFPLPLDSIGNAAFGRCNDFYSWTPISLRTIETLFE